MYRIAIVSDNENIQGFRLAGVDSYAVSSDAEACRVINTLLNEDTVGIIAVNESYMSALDQRTLKKIDSVYRPIVVALPIDEKISIDTDNKKTTSTSSSLSRIIRKAVGFDVQVGKK